MIDYFYIGASQFLDFIKYHNLTSLCDEARSGAPLKGAPSDDLEIQVRQQAMSLLCIAGLARLPQVSLPLATLDGLPLGFSLIARWGADAQLLALSKRLTA